MEHDVRAAVRDQAPARGAVDEVVVPAARRRDLPRSLHYCLGRVDRHLNSLADFHGHRHECHRISGVLYSRLRYGQIDRIFRRGLHPVLTDFIGSIAELSEELRRNYLMTT